MIFTFNLEKHISYEAFLSQYKLGMRMHKLIYTLVDELKDYLTANAVQDINFNDKDFFKGVARVKEVFDLRFEGKKRKVAGIEVLSGGINDRHAFRIIRDNELQEHNLKCVSLKQDGIDKNLLKEKEIGGIIFSEFDEVEVGDMIQSYDVKLNKLAILDFRGCSLSF